MKIIPRIIILLLTLWAIYASFALFNHNINHNKYRSKKELLYVSNHMTTIVTAYYPFEKAKHTRENYAQWLTNLLAYINNPIVIFTHEKHFPLLYKFRNEYTNKTMSTIYILNFSSPLEMPPIKRLENIFRQQLNNDPEKALHSVDLYAIWCAKSYMLNLTSTLNPFRSHYFLWIDGGSFRNRKYRFNKWPDPHRISMIFNNNDRLLLGLVNPLRNNSCYLNNNNEKHMVPKYDLIEGGIIGGSLLSIQWWTNLFYRTIDEFIDMNEFIGKDQYIMNYIVLTNPWKINVILAYEAFCENVWYVYGPLLANDDERWLLFGNNCQANNITNLVRPLDEVCST